MKAFKSILAAFLALTLLVCAAPCAYAEGGEATRSYADMSWDEVMAQLLEEYEVSPELVAAGYCNLVTGEEHYLNGSEYKVAASMYKVPLCMYYTEHIASGDIDWSSYANYFSYKDKQDSVLIYSSNEDAMFLWDLLGGYTQFRQLTSEYMGVEPGSEDYSITDNNMYTAEEFIHCLRLLYNEREQRFPDVIETMQQAEPNRFFKLNEPRFRIAHKPGWITDTGVWNDCAICFTLQPIAIVLFTQRLPYAEDFLTAFCTAMCEYTEAQAAKPEPTPEPAPKSEPPAVEEIAAAEPSPAPLPALQTVSSPELFGLPLLPLAFIALFALLGLVSIIVFSVKYRARFFTLFLSLLLCVAAMGMSVAGTHLGTVYARPSGDPVRTVTDFFDALCAGNYGAACRQLRDYADLGLDTPPSSAAAQRVSEALRASYSYELLGECRTDKLDAVQRVRFTYLSLPAIEADVEAETLRQIEAIVNSRPTYEVYDENRQYLPAVTDEAYLAALDAVLAHAEDYYAETELELSLSYTADRWQMLAGPELLRAVNGGTGY